MLTKIGGSNLFMEQGKIPGNDKPPTGALVSLIVAS